MGDGGFGGDEKGRIGGVWVGGGGGARRMRRGEQRKDVLEN
jgi:hypothetical protein